MNCLYFVKSVETNKKKMEEEEKQKSNKKITNLKSQLTILKSQGAP
jgi:hypothetical protein